MTEETRKVELNLEETGTLCHLLMEQLSPVLLGKQRVNRIERAIVKRQLALYAKLSEANRSMMYGGKDSGDGDSKSGSADRGRHAQG